MVEALQDEKRQIYVKVIKVWKTTILCMRQNKVLNWSSTFAQLLSMHTKQFQIEDLLFISQILFLFIQEALPQMHCISLGACSSLQVFFSCNKYLTFRKIASEFTQCRAHSLRLPSKHPEVPGA